MEECIKIGELVSEETVEHYINVLPPACMNGVCIQIGEPTMHLEGGAVYSTLMRVQDGWAYAGDCYRGETIDRTNEINEAIKRWNRGE